MIRLIPLILSFSILISCTPDFKAPTKIEGHIPLKSFFIARFNQGQKSVFELSKSAYFQKLDSIFPMENFQREMQRIDSLNLRLELKNPIYLAGLNTGAEKFDLIWLTPDVNIPELFNPEGTSIEYDGEEIIQLSKNNWYFLRANGVLALSKSELAIKEVIKQQHAKVNLGQFPDFKKAFSISNQSDPLNIFVNLDRTPDYLKTVFPNGSSSYLPSLGTWVSFDLNPKSTSWIFSGIVMYPDSTHKFFSSLEKGGKENHTAWEIWPKNAAGGVNLVVDDFLNYYQNFVSFQKKNKTLSKNRRLLPEDFTESQIEEFNLAVDNEWGLFFLENTSGKISDNQVGYLKMDDAETILNILANYTHTENQTYRSSAIFKFSASGILPGIFGRFFKSFTAPYYFISGDFLLFSQNALSLKNVINALEAQRTLARSEAFDAFLQSFSGESNFMVVGKTPEILGILKQVVNIEDARKIESDRKGFENIGIFGLQVTAEKQAGVITAVFKPHGKNEEKEGRQLWSVPLNANLIGKPHPVLNHYTKEYEVLVQDKDNRLYLIDRRGKILWERKISGQILGDVHQIDAYRNNKLQMAFVTQKSLMLIDRLGRDVENFPISLSPSASAGLTVFDYDKTRHYRLVVPTGNTLSNYDVSGKKVEGWNFSPKETPILIPPKHLRVGDKDYILVVESSGQPHLLDRRGETRVEVKVSFPGLQTDLFDYQPDPEQAPQLIGLNSQGKMVSLYFDGSGETVDIGLPDGFANVHSDGVTMVILNGESFIVKDPKHPFEKDLTDNPSFGPVMSNQFYGYSSLEEDKVYIWNKEGKLLDGFPQFGGSGFCIKKLWSHGGTDLIIGTKEKTLIAYRID